MNALAGLRVYSVHCACGIVWQTTLGPKYQPRCSDPKTGEGCGRKLPSREEILAREVAP